MARLRYNGLTATLGAPLASGDTTVTFAAPLTHSGGTALPTLSSGDYIPLSILATSDPDSSVSEIVSLTAYTSGATTGTISRAQESTTATAHASGVSVVHGPTAADFASSSASGSWTKSVDLPLSTLTGWTAGSGTWAISGGVIRQSDTTASPRRLHLDTRVPLAEVIAQVDVKLDLTPNNISSRGGFIFGTPATADGPNAMLVALVSKGSTTQATAVDFEKDATTSYGQDNLDSPIGNGTWITFRVHKVGTHFSVFVNGTLATSHRMVGDIGGQMGRFALYSYASDVSFRNLAVWSPTQP